MDTTHITINLLEVSSELAELKIFEELKIEDPADLCDDDGCYLDLYQDMFNKYYDFYYNFLMNLKRK